MLRRELSAPMELVGGLTDLGEVSDSTFELYWGNPSSESEER